VGLAILTEAGPISGPPPKMQAFLGQATYKACLG